MIENILNIKHFKDIPNLITIAINSNEGYATYLFYYNNNWWLLDEGLEPHYNYNPNYLGLVFIYKLTLYELHHIINHGTPFEMLYNDIDPHGLVAVYGQYKPTNKIYFLDIIERQHIATTIDNDIRDYNIYNEEEEELISVNAIIDGIIKVEFES